MIPKKLELGIKRYKRDEIDLISRAYLFARCKHHGQKRKSGSPYILHPLRVALALVMDKYDATAVTGALLHDTLEDTQTSYEELKKHFGPTIADLVESETKVAAMRVKTKKLTSSEALFLQEVDNYRKLFLAMSSDIRVIIIRLYDRLDNVRSLRLIHPDKRRFYARETLQIYAPIAERLGMGVVKGELEDLSFPFAYPDKYKEFVKIAKPAYHNPGRVVANVQPVLRAALRRHGIRVLRTDGRAKRLYSLYAKMTNDNKNISEIYDIAAVRIIVKDIGSCYQTLGIVHNLFSPLPGRIKDYIAQPKTSGYQSLHTTVKDGHGNIFEVQVRTEEMHEIAEFGPAAHWNYKDSAVEKNLKTAEKNRKEWLEELQKVRSSDNREFLRQLKEEFFSKRVFVFTPKGKVIGLPKGSSGVDFAYRIHTELGNSCNGVKINGRLMPLGTILQTGDVVEILPSKKSAPTRDWLKFVKTSYARHHIKAHLPESRRPPASPSRQTTLDKTGKPIKRIIKLTRDNTVIDALKGIRHKTAACCNPDAKYTPVIGYVSRDHVLRIHKKSCKRLKAVDERRLVEL